MNILSGLNLQEIEKITDLLGASKFRARQIHNWIYLKSVSGIDEMTDLSVKFREELKKVAKVTDIKIKVKQVSSDGTIKYLLEFPYLKTGEKMAPAPVSEIHAILLAHLEDLYDFYGLDTGVKVARKHISWYTKGLVGSAAFRKMMNTLPTVEAQREAVDLFFQQYAAEHDHLQYEENKTLEEALAA